MSPSNQPRSTANLWLRPVRLDDLDQLCEVETDPATNHHRPSGAPSRAEVAEHLEDVVRSWRQHGVGYWAVERDGEFLGVAGLRATTVSGRDCWNLYYRLRPSFWGKGFATEAAREALDVAGKLRPRLPVIARTRPANDAAKKVAARAGMDRHPELDADGFEVFAHGW